MSDPESEGHSLLVIPHGVLDDGLPEGLYGTDLQIDGLAATLSVVAPHQDSFGYACSCDPKAQLDRFLLPSPLATISVVNYELPPGTGLPTMRVQVLSPMEPPRVILDRGKVQAAP